MKATDQIKHAAFEKTLDYLLEDPERNATKIMDMLDKVAPADYTMKISRDDKGDMHLKDILTDGKSVEDEKIYSFCYVDVSGHTLLERAYNYDMSKHGGVHMYKAEADIREGEKYDGYIAHTTNVAQQWIQYFADGGRLAAPEAYIQKS